MAVQGMLMCTMVHTGGMQGWGKVRGPGLEAVVLQLCRRARVAHARGEGAQPHSSWQAAALLLVWPSQCSEFPRMIRGPLALGCWAGGEAGRKGADLVSQGAAGRAGWG